MSPIARKRFVQLVGQVLIGDGLLTDAERDYLESLMDELEMPKDERTSALGEVSVDSPVEERVREIPEEMRARLVEAMEQASQIDDDPSPSEAALIARVRALSS